MNIRKRPTTPAGRRTWAVGALLALSIGVLVPAAGSAVLGSARSSADAAKSLRAQTDQSATLAVWSAAPGGSATDVTPKKFRSYRLDQDAIAAILARAPHERTAAAENAPLVLSLPGPGGFPQRFALQESPVMQAELATYRNQRLFVVTRG